MLRTALFASTALIALIAASPALAERRAFVAGVADYAAAALDVPGNRTANNATDIGAALTSAGWQVNVGVNETQAQFAARLAAFMTTIGPTDTVLFYYAGQGAQIGTHNWLLMRDVNARAMTDAQWEAELARSGVDLAAVSTQLSGAGAREVVVIIDAAQHDPNAALAGLGLVKPINPTAGPTGTFSIFAADAGTRALVCLVNDPACAGDTSRNTVFTRQLIPLIGQPSMVVADLANRVQGAVGLAASRAGYTQMPAIFDGLGNNKVVLGPTEFDQLSTTVTAPTTTAQPLADGAGRASGGVLAAESYNIAPPPQPYYLPSPTLTYREENRDQFVQFADGRVLAVDTNPVSTFSIDVDTASYSFIRNSLEDGRMPSRDAVRIEEMINYFNYNYRGPESTREPFAANVAVYPTPWNRNTQLLHIGIKGYEPPAEVDPASNLVFLIDTSGSMDSPDKLPLLIRSFGLLVDQLTANDTVSIVVYAGSAGVVLRPTRGDQKARILAALDSLHAGGSTAGGAGIALAYRMAEENMVRNGGINRVILATDGDFNVGISNPDQLKQYISTKRQTGISLSVLGFGQGNYNDALMQALAQNGNGNASYIDSFREAQRVFVEEIGGTLQTIASDVKIQIEFNPAVVAEYRLIGYETRALNREDFNNDRVDAGEIGAGHTVTAIYEITPVGSPGTLVDPLRYGTNPTTAAPADGEIAFLKLRYKLPGESESTLMEMPIGPSLVADSIDVVPTDLRFAAAVAAFGQKLRGGDFNADMSYADIRRLALGARGEDEGGYRAEFISLISLAASLDR